MWNERSGSQQFLIKIVSNYLVKTNRGVSRARISDYKISPGGLGWSGLLSELWILLTSLSPLPACQIDVIEKIKLKRSELRHKQARELFIGNWKCFVFKNFAALFFHTTGPIIGEPLTCNNSW